MEEFGEEIESDIVDEDNIEEDDIEILEPTEQSITRDNLNSSSSSSSGKRVNKVTHARRCHNQHRRKVEERL